MAAEEVCVSFGALAQAAADTEQVAGAIEQPLADLRAYLAPLAATWTGSAASQQRLLQGRWDAGAQDLCAVLRQIARALDLAAEGYRQVERRNAEIWR